MSGYLDRAGIPDDILDRILELERRLDDLVGFAAMPTIDPEAGEGATTYIEILQEIELAAGADIALSGTSPDYTIARAGDTVLLFDSGGAVLREFAATDAGFTSALAAMADGDACKLPVVTITGGPWTVSAGTVVGTSREGSVLDGQVTVNDGTAMESLTIDRDEDDAGAIYGVVDGGGTATLTNVTVNVANATGPAYAVYIAAGGRIDAYDTELLAETGSDGYAAYILNGDFRHYGGRAVGTESPLSYYLV